MIDSHGLSNSTSSSAPRVLLLGGTSEASSMAQALALNAIDGIFSYAGRTDSPRAQPMPTRVGGFGGVQGLIQWLKVERISHVIDATHPFAQQISAHVMTACSTLHLPLLALERPPWENMFSVRWFRYPDFESLVLALPKSATRIFLAIGRSPLHYFTAQPQHIYLVRLVDPPRGPLPLPNTHVVVGQGPFSETQEAQLMQVHAIQALVVKNSGGTGGKAKLHAAEQLDLPVYIVERPTISGPRTVVSEVNDVLRWLAHH
ncbi:MAG: cobalt-precorrin-6A reductase [Myxococcales bacterium]|nr:cobalt-precorrin-6A reductase [Myxococcales bacterium]